MSKPAILAALIGLAWATLADATEGDEGPVRDLVHSDLPLFVQYEGEVWPQGFTDEDSWGCSSRVAFGDWYLPLGSDDDGEWFQITNYGVFHCYAVVSSAADREDLASAQYEYSLFVKIGEVSDRQGPLELWAIQMGGRPGSDYLLLSRRKDEGLIEKFDLLQTDCPQEFVRDAGPIDILSTRYCAINSRGDLLRFAESMAERMPVGTMSRISSSAPTAEDQDE